MKILYLCHRFPYPPRRGGKIRPYHMIRHLSQSHQVTVASLVRSDEEAAEAKGLAPYCTHYEIGRVYEGVQMLRMIAQLPTQTPSSMAYFYSPELAGSVSGLLARQSFDLIFVHCSSVAQYVENVRGIPKILDFGDMDSQKWLDYARYKMFPVSLGYRIEGKKLERAEKQLATRFDMCTVITRAEWETLESFATGVASDWFPNGVDSAYFVPTAEPYDSDTIVFVGRMDYFPNQECVLDFCAKVLPCLQSKHPSLKFVIVGANPSSPIRHLAKQHGVTVTGSVPDVRPYLRRAALMVAPLKIARGTQNKILEAMAAGIPVVTSPVAAGGVDASSPEHFLVASTTDEYVATISRVLDDPAERARLARAGRARVLSHHAWEKSMHRLDGIIERCLSGVNRKTPALQV